MALAANVSFHAICWTFDPIICCFLFRPFFTKPLAFAEVALRWWTNQTAKCGKWESRATSEIFVATEVIRQPVALISRSRAQIATRVQSPPEAMDGVTTQCNRSCLAIHPLLLWTRSAKYPLSPLLHLAIHSAILCSPILQNFTSINGLLRAQLKSRCATSVLNSKFLMRSNKHKKLSA